MLTEDNWNDWPRILGVLPAVQLFHNFERPINVQGAFLPVQFVNDRGVVEHNLKTLTKNIFEEKACAGTIFANFLHYLGHNDRNRYRYKNLVKNSRDVLRVLDKYKPTKNATVSSILEHKSRFYPIVYYKDLDSTNRLHLITPVDAGCHWSNCYTWTKEIPQKMIKKYKKNSSRMVI